MHSVRAGGAAKLARVCPRHASGAGRSWRACQGTAEKSAALTCCDRAERPCLWRVPSRAPCRYECEIEDLLKERTGALPGGQPGCRFVWAALCKPCFQHRPLPCVPPPAWHALPRHAHVSAPRPCPRAHLSCSAAGGKEDELRKVAYGRYKSVSPSAFGLGGRKAIAVVRAAGERGSPASTGGGRRVQLWQRCSGCGLPG